VSLTAVWCQEHLRWECRLKGCHNPMSGKYMLWCCPEHENDWDSGFISAIVGHNKKNEGQKIKQE
jgi:hypothetical protein